MAAPSLERRENVSGVPSFEGNSARGSISPRNVDADGPSGYLSGPISADRSRTLFRLPFLIA